MGVGNYSETDVQEASRAFTGWTIALTPPRGYYNRWDWEFEYNEEDHDDGEKTFLGHTGHFNGEDIIDIIVQQPACHRFIARHLYNFFVADEPQVPAWQTTPPRDPQSHRDFSQPSPIRTATSARRCGCCSSLISLKRRALPGSRVPPRWSSAS